MRFQRLPLRAAALAAALMFALLLVAGCAKKEEPPPYVPPEEILPYEPPVPPPPPPPPEALAPCAAMRGERVPPETCERISRLARAAGAFNAPDAMVRDETTRIRFALDRDNDAAAAAAAVDTLPGETVSIETRAGRFMRVTLTGQGFEVKPLDPERKDLFASPLASWEWDVTPEEEGDRILTLRTFVEIPMADGEMKTAWEQIENREIRVSVTFGQRVEDIAAESEAWLKRGQNWLIALAAFITALGGVWLAIRSFGRKGGEPPA